MTDASDEESRTGFLDLAPELRNRIYELCVRRVACMCCAERMFANETDSHECTRREFFSCRCGSKLERIFSASTISTSSRDTAQPTISRASKILRAESLPMFYGLNTFFVFRVDLPRRSSWYKKIRPHNMKLLRHIVFRDELTNEPTRKLGQLRKLGLDVEKCKVTFLEIKEK